MNGSTAPDCSQPPTVAYYYRSTDPTKAGVPLQTFAGTVASGLQPYDPANPPSDVATTTTDEGTTVPFIVREETGYSLRDQYKIAALWDPKQGSAPDPTAANPGFANKLVLTHGASCEPGTSPVPRPTSSSRTRCRRGSRWPRTRSTTQGTTATSSRRPSR